MNTEKLIVTHREIEVLKLIASGMQSKDIAEKLFIDVKTVKNHRYSITKKLNASHMAHAVAMLYEGKITTKDKRVVHGE